MDANVEFLSRYPEEIQAIANALRTVVKGGARGVQEVLYARQQHWGYSFSGRYSEQMVYVLPMKDYVRLGFYWGGFLPDPKNLLVGEGKRLRHVKLYHLAEARDPAVKALVKAAWADAKAKRGKT
jgi:hypothetical protein